MAVKDATDPITHTHCIDITFKQAVLKSIRQIYVDMAAGVDPETLAAALISTDATNALVQGTDDLLWVDGA